MTDNSSTVAILNGQLKRGEDQLHLVRIGRRVDKDAEKNLLAEKISLEEKIDSAEQIERQGAVD